MSEHTVSDLCRAVLEHDERATKGPWTYKHNYSFTRYGHKIVAHSGECRLATVDESVGEHDEIRLPGDGPLIAHYRSACPTIAREYLRLERLVALADAWADSYWGERGCPETPDCKCNSCYRAKEYMLARRAKDPQAEGEK